MLGVEWLVPPKNHIIQSCAWWRDVLEEDAVAFPFRRADRAPTPTSTSSTNGALPLGGLQRLQSLIDQRKLRAEPLQLLQQLAIRGTALVDRLSAHFQELPPFEADLAAFVVAAEELLGSEALVAYLARLAHRREPASHLVRIHESRAVDVCLVDDQRLVRILRSRAWVSGEATHVHSGEQ